MSRCIICNWNPDTDEEKNYMTESHDVCMKCSNVIQEAVRDYDWDTDELMEIEEMKAIDDYTLSVSYHSFESNKDVDVKEKSTSNPCGDEECGRFSDELDRVQCECDLEYANRINAKFKEEIINEATVKRNLLRTKSDLLVNRK